MTRLIDADAFKRTFCAECVASQCENCNIDYHFEHLAPTVDPIKHGYWEKDSTCSVCGEKAIKKLIFCDETLWEDEYDYCPHCGAKMDLEEEA